MDENVKIVDYELYCPKCKYIQEPESCDECNDCLNNPYNINSKKPIRFEEEE